MTTQQKIESFRRELGDEKPPFRADIETIQAAVCAAFGIELSDLLSPCRRPEFTYPRFASFCLCSKNHHLTSNQIALAHGGRDHSTALSGVKRCAELLEVDAQFRFAFERAERLLKNQSAERVK